VIECTYSDETWRVNVNRWSTKSSLQNLAVIGQGRGYRNPSIIAKCINFAVLTAPLGPRYLPIIVTFGMA